ncbi:MAG TPA: DUF4157 domain-containing protein, partial [Candidatus Angelobacter sp.]
MRTPEPQLQRTGADSGRRNLQTPPMFLQTQSVGRPLDSSTRQFMESRFGYDFSGVRIHTDARAAELAGA